MIRCMLMSLGLLVLGFLGSTSADDRKPPPKAFGELKPTVGTLEVNIALNPKNVGKPAKDGWLTVRVYKILPPLPGRIGYRYEEIDTKVRSIPVKMGENDQGPWSRDIKGMPVATPLRVAVDVRVPWSIKEALFKGFQENIKLQPGEVKKVELIITEQFLK